MKRSAPRVALVALLAGCAPAAVCPVGYDQVGSLCIPSDAAVADAGALDASDASPDTGASCRSDTDCHGATPICRPTTHTCVGCLSMTDCLDPSASVCVAATRLCVPCSTNADCTHLGLPTTCASGTCIQCSATDETACGANSCDLATHLCTRTPRASLHQCEHCLADSECMSGMRCVPMTFMGTPRPGGYCLTPATGTGCGACGVLTPARASLSGAAAETYCGVAEDYTTCEATLGVYAPCTTDDQCGAPDLDDGSCHGTSCLPHCSVTCQCPGGFGYTCRADHTCG